MHILPLNSKVFLHIMVNSHVYSPLQLLLLPFKTFSFDDLGRTFSYSGLWVVQVRQKHSIINHHKKKGNKKTQRNGKHKNDTDTRAHC